MSDLHTIEGYVMCARGFHTWVLREVAARTGGLCSECFLTVGHMRSVEIVGQGRRTQVRIRPASRPKPMTETRRHNRKLSVKAKQRARKRLAAIFSDAFDILVAEERAALGLEPWPTEMAVRGGTEAQDEAFARIMHELDKAGADTR